MKKFRIRNVLTSSINRLKAARDRVKAIYTKTTQLPGRLMAYVRRKWTESGPSMALDFYKGYAKAGMEFEQSCSLAELGLSVFRSQYTFFLSDIDGVDLATSLKDSIDVAIGGQGYWNRPIKVFMTSGLLGIRASAEYAVLYVIEGVPLVFSSHVRMEGIDEYDADFKTADSSVMASLMSMNSKNVVSLGFVDPNTDVTSYVSQFMQHNPAMKSQDISYSLVRDFSKSNAMRYWGAIYRPGGYMYDIYTADHTVSLSIRPNKDFTKDPLNENANLPNGMEVLLVGGEPDVVSIGTICNMKGYLFDVWVPNTKRFYKAGMDMMANGVVPVDDIEFNEDDMIESYAFLMKSLHELDEETNGPDEEEDDDSETKAVPIVTDDSIDDDEEVPVLIELPEYLA